MKTTIPLLTAIMLVAVGCSSAPPLQTRSGRPEVTIHNRTVAKVRAAVTNHFVDAGWAPTSSQGMQLVFDRKGSVGQDFLMGLMTDNPQSTNRITITLIENGSDVRVVGGIAVLGSTNFGKTQAVELTAKGYPQLQADLEAIKSATESR